MELVPLPSTVLCHSHWKSLSWWRHNHYPLNTCGHSVMKIIITQWFHAGIQWWIVSITQRFHAAPVWANQDFIWYTNCILTVSTFSVYIRRTFSDRLWANALLGQLYSINLMAPFRGVALRAQMEAFNKSVSNVWTSVEWLFGDIVEYFKFRGSKKNLKIGLSSVGKLCCVCPVEESVNLPLWEFDTYTEYLISFTFPW